MKHMPLAGMWQLKAHLADEGGVQCAGSQLERRKTQ
jgi:hypothetical protein